MALPAAAAPPSPGALAPESALAAACQPDDTEALAEDVTAQAGRRATDRALEERERLVSSLTEVRHPDGSVSVDLQEAFWNRIVMQRNADGSISIRCFPAGSRPFSAIRPLNQPLETK
jgi:hypothetical protein